LPEYRSILANVIDGYSIHGDFSQLIATSNNSGPCPAIATLTLFLGPCLEQQSGATRAMGVATTRNGTMFLSLDTIFIFSGIGIYIKFIVLLL
jgi:hypothetical protein